MILARALKHFSLASLMLCVLTVPAMAYIDSGTGSMILQAIAGVAIAASLYWRRLVDRVRQFFSRRRKDKD
jgi:drug/metabolite transporter superfamily protein YnfA